MKQMLTIGFLVLLALAACNPSAEVAEHGRSEEGPNPELSAIDSLMWRQPDSALAVLQQFAASSEADSLDKFNEHYCQLLISELLYKNDYGQSNRPALQQAVRYFDSLCLCKGVVRNVSTIAFLDARAHYINGVGYYEHDSVVEACKEYLKALEVMEGHFEKDELTEHRARFMAYTYNRLMELFSAQFMMDPAIACGEKALAYCQKEPSLNNEIPNTLFHIGKQYQKKGEKGKARNYYRQAIEGIVDTNTSIYRDIVSAIALNDYQIGLGYEQSICSLRQILLQSKNEEERLARFLTIGAIFSEEGIYDSALLYLTPVFENDANVISQTRASEYLSIIFDSIGDREQSYAYMRFLSEHKKSEGENKALVSKLEYLFQNYKNKKQEKQAEETRTKSIKRTIEITIPIAVAIALGLLVLTKLRSRKLLRKQQEEAKRALEEAGRQHEQELIQQREEALAAERTHRIQQSALSNRLKRSNEELRELKDQIRQQTDSMNPKQEAQALSFNDEPICRLIMERVNEGQFKSKMDYTSYKDYALGKDDLVALREAANRHFNQFTIRLAKAYPALTQGDLDYCCLYLLGLSDADVSALMQRAYNTVNERNSKLRRVFGSENAISFTLQAIANESVSI
jgi:tetratricopeptide (TPR) repeat protein